MAWRPLQIQPLLMCLVLCVAATTRAAPTQQSERQVLTLDPAHSLAEFELRLMWLIPVHGRFGALHGAIIIDRFHGSARVDAHISVNDVHMRSAGYEAWVKSAEFFDTAHYPQIYFVSDSFSLTRLQKGGEVDGALTIRGVTRRVHFELTVSTCADTIARACAIAATGTIRRSDFGMRSRRGVLSDKVQLDFSVYVLPSAETAQ